jgi:uncharacterized membrane protein (UPF0127 family)
MIRSMRLLVIALALSVSACTSHQAFADTATDGATQLDRMFSRSTLQIATPDARLHTFKVWIADTDQRRARGLMFVKELADDTGMLFVYDQAQPIGMWMKNTFISLDMVFVAADGKVINVAERTEPHSLKTIESNGDAIGVIELKAGTAAKLHIAKGARVMHAAFGSAKK